MNNNNNNARIGLVNGLGDKLLDLVGFSILCKYLNYKPHVQFLNNGKQPWGTPAYDIQLFDFSDDVVVLRSTSAESESTAYYVNSYNPSSSLCPYKVYRFISQFIPDITFEQISNDFVTYSKKIITPSQAIISNLPTDIEKAYGIHLRKSDKVSDTCDIRHENLRSEFNIIVNKLLEDVQHIILTDPEPIFLIVSEDAEWKQEVGKVIVTMSEKSNKPIKILDIDYSNKNNYFNYSSVIDMFCLSKCKEILQGVKYSSFSIVASLLGNNKIRNYAKYCNSYHVCLIHSWSSAININGGKNFDKNFHEKITSTVKPIETNIITKYRHG
jgi:hypothetical protein